MKDEYGHYFEDTSIFQIRPEELEWIKNLKMTGKEFFEVFDWSQWWFPAGIKEFTGYLSWYADDPEYKEWPFQRNFANPRLVVFDTRPDMPDIQIVRILQLLSPPYGSQTCWRLNEAEVEPGSGRVCQCRGYRNRITDYHGEIINTLTNDRLGNKN